MAQQQWQVQPVTGVCSVSGKKLEEGEEFYTVLFEDGESFRRADCCVDSWDGPPEGSYCFFKTRVPVKEKRKKLLVDNDLLVNFFTRLADETELVRVQFRFVLALILMRKRILRYDETKKENGEEIWEMTLVSEQAAHRVVNPRLTDDQIEGVSTQLTAILHGDMGDWSEPQNEPQEPATNETSSADAGES